MKKTFRVNEKKLSLRYNKQLFIVNIPAISIALTLLIISTVIFPHISQPTIVICIAFYALNGTVAFSFVTCLIGSVKASIRINAHKQNTYIEILNSDMVVSQHMQTMFRGGKRVHYKKLWVIRLNDIKDASYCKGTITINAPARLFYQNTEWLKYKCGDSGINFDHWWYNENGGISVQTVEFVDYYTYGEAVVKRILYCSNKYKQKEERYLRFREEMLNIAANTGNPPEVSPKDKPSGKKKTSAGTASSSR